MDEKNVCGAPEQLSMIKFTVAPLSVESQRSSRTAKDRGGIFILLTDVLFVANNALCIFVWVCKVRDCVAF